MSASTPGRTSRPTEPTAPRRRRPDGMIVFGLPIWWLMSAVFHALILGWLVFFSPVRIIDLRTSKAGDTAGTGRIREVMDHVRDLQAERLADRVRLLQEIQSEMDRLDAEKEAEWRKFAAEFATNAASVAEQSQAGAAQAQADALAAQTEAAGSVEQARQAQTEAAFEAAGAPQKKAVDAQGRAGPLMDRALQALSMGGPVFEPARQAQAQANELQRQAEAQQVAVNEVRVEAPYPRQRARQKQEDAVRAREAQAKQEGDIAAAAVKAQAMRAEIETGQREAQAAQTAAAEARTQAEKAAAEYASAKTAYAQLDAKSPDRKAAKETVNRLQKTARETAEHAATAQRKVELGKSQIEAAVKKAERAQESQRNAETRLAQQKAKVEQAAREADEAAKQAREVGEKLVRDQATARTRQEEARAAQEKARQALASVPRPAAAAMTTAMESAAPQPVVRELPDVYRMELPELYQTAVATEKTSTETYKRIRATELALLRQIPQAQAMALTDVARTVRPDLKTQLEATPSTSEDAAQLREVVQTAGTEVEAMVSLGASMLALAKGLELGKSDGAAGATVSLEWIRAKAGHMQAMEGLAAEDSDARAKDLSGEMQKSGGPAAGAGAGTGPGAAAAAGAPGRPGRPTYDGGPPPFPKTYTAVPGRKVKAGAAPAGWMYVDSWYILGPFDNARRENIEKKFPPETVVDLNASYVGKDNQPVRWEFHQAGSPRVSPPFARFHPERRQADYGADMGARGLEYIIFYAYTEMYFEAACDAWIAVGSDDFSKLWIEDQLVWASGKQQKSWRIDEGLRKVHFRPGVNRILFRVENGWHATDFSLVISLR